MAVTQIKPPESTFNLVEDSEVTPVLAKSLIKWLTPPQSSRVLPMLASSAVFLEGDNYEHTEHCKTLQFIVEKIVSAVNVVTRHGSLTVTVNVVDHNEPLCNVAVKVPMFYILVL